MRGLYVIAGLMLLPIGASPQDRTIPPDPTVTPLPPVTRRRVKIYRCPHQKAGAPAWVFVAPEATLYAGAQQVGMHTAGPTWRWSDGTAVVGHMLVSQPSSEHGAIPWLLLAASPAVDSAPAGMLAHVTYVRRSETHGGLPPGSCDPRHIGAMARVPYAALYTFYKAQERPKSRR